MKKMTFISIILSLFFYVSCACSSSDNQGSTPIHDPAVKDLNAWIGRPVSELLTHPQFGTPDDKVKVGDDNVVIYKQIFNAKRVKDDQLTVNIFCRRKFIYGPNNIIRAVTEEGTCKDTRSYLPKNNPTR